MRCRARLRVVRSGEVASRFGSAQAAIGACPGTDLVAAIRHGSAFALFFVRTATKISENQRLFARGYPNGRLVTKPGNPLFADQKPFLMPGYQLPGSGHTYIGDIGRR